MRSIVEEREKKMYKHISKSAVLKLLGQMTYLEGQVTSKTIAQNKYVSMTLFAFDTEEAIRAHQSKGDAIATISNGESRMIIDKEIYHLVEDETMIMSAGVPHTLYAVDRFKRLLTVVFSVA